jgi:hypothetical protein
MASQALLNLAQYIAKVANEVRGRVEAGKVPSTQEQLDNYIKQVVDQLQKLTKGAPKNIQDQMNEPFEGQWNYQRNMPLQPKKLTVQLFLDVLDQLAETFPVDAPAPGKGAAKAAATPAASTAAAAAAPAANKGGAAAASSGKGAAAAPAPAAPAAAAAGKGPPPFATASRAATSPAPEPSGKGYAPANASKGSAPQPAPSAAPAVPSGGMRADAASFVPGGWSQDLSKKEGVSKTRRDVAPPVSEASKRLPTWEKKDWIIAGIRHNVVTVISGDTGCGKSTLIPQLVCDAADLVPADKVVVCTQPRRVAAITLAEYVARDRGQELGDEVGYQIRFINKFSENTRLIYATTAIVLRRLHSEPTLDSIGCLIIDEVHERDVYTDFLLLLIKEAMLNGKMPHMKIVLMSATLKAADFADYFRKVNGATALKPVHIPGRMFAVEDYYWEDACEWCCFCPPQKGAGKGGKKGDRGKGKGGDDPADGIEAAYQAIKADNTPKDRPGKDRCNEFSEKTLQACSMWRENDVYQDLIEDLVHYFHKEMPKGDGAILIFLPGWGDITKLYIRLYKSGENFTLITLHSLMTPEQQHEAFERAPEGYRKIVLSTNIAEASVTIDDVVYVIDTGVRKERTYDPATGISSLDTKMVTRANAIQRRGRAGRCQLASPPLRLSWRRRGWLLPRPSPAFGFLLQTVH